MSPRYYWISFLIVIVFTLIIGFLSQQKSGKHLALIAIKVLCGFLILVGLVAIFVKLLVFFGVAENTFVI